MSEVQNSFDQLPASAHPRAKERYIEVSGPDQYGRPKTHIMFSFCERYSDGSETVLQEVAVSLKPIVSVFHHAGYVNVSLDFQHREDMDLGMVWHLLEDYQRPINSVDWLPEELETGFYEDESGKQHMVYFPMLEMTISLKGKETEFALTGLNPLFFTLQPSGPKGDPCVLQLTFQEDWFFVTEDLSQVVDMDEIRTEVMAEMGLDMME